jgi:hypothetical protein
MEPYLASGIITRFFEYKDLIKDFMTAVNVTKLLLIYLFSFMFREVYILRILGICYH